jgi:hypothetical protein
MTFPIGKDTPRHPSMPRRPSRPARTTGIFFEREVRPGILQTIATTADAVHVRRTRDGKIVGGYFFRLGLDLEILERAIELSSRERLQSAGHIVVPSGVEIHVGAGEGAVHMRTRRPDGVLRGHTRIEGEELTALALAVAELRKSHAAKATNSKPCAPSFR